MKKILAYLLAVLMVFSVFAVPVSAHSTDLPSNISQWGADIDILLDGYNGLGEITSWEGNNDKLLGFGNSELDEAQYSFTVKMGETEFNRITLYALDYYNGAVVLPQAVTFVVNGNYYDAVITPNDCGIGTIVAELGETVLASEVTVIITMGTSPYEFGAFHMFSEIEFAKSSAEPVIPTDPAEIVDAAYALANGEALSYKATLTGEIIAVNTVYSEAYKNITVTIAVEGKEDMPIQCYRLKGDGVDIIKVGDIITVTGTLKNYHGTIEFDAGCSLDAIDSTGDEIVMPSTPQEIVDAAYALDQGSTLPYTATLTGEIVSVDTPYEEPYQNITVTIVIDGMHDKPIQCYRLRGDGANTIKVGDVITVSGTIMNYYGSIEFGSGCSLISVDYTEQAPESGNSGIIYFDRANHYDWTNKEFGSDAFGSTAASAGEILLAVANDGRTVADLIGGNWFTWFINVRAQKNSEGAFVITDISPIGDASYENWSICENEIVFMCNTSYASTEAAGNAEEVEIIKNLQVGDELYLNVSMESLYDACGALDNVFVSLDANDVPEEPDVPVSDNIALNKPYEISGCGTNGTYNANLTDGVAYTQMAASGEWFAFQRGSSDGIGCIIIDLENYYNISEVRVNFVNQDSWGVPAPACATVYTSADGKNFEYAADLPIDSAIQSEAYWSVAEFGANARYIKVEVTLSGTFAFLNEIEVYGEETTYIPEEPAYKEGLTIEIDESLVCWIESSDLGVIESGLTDGNWGAGDENDWHNASGIYLLWNKVCTNADIHPEVNLIYNFGQTPAINTFDLGLYSSYNVMVGYPSDEVQVYYSDNGTDWFFAETALLGVGEPSVDNAGSVTTTVTLSNDINAQYIKLVLTFPDSPFPYADKPVWEFMGLTEVEFYYAESVDPIEDYYELPVSHQNCYNWGTYESMIISGDGKTVVDVISQSPYWWIMYVVENVDGRYVATEYYQNCDEVNTTVVPEGGFLWYVYSENSAYTLADEGKLLNYTFVLDDWDLHCFFAIDTFGGYAPRIIKAYAPGTYVPGTPEEPEVPDVPDVPDVPSGGNVALNKPYETSPLFRQGGASVGWGWDENASIAYPDEGGITLTDGIFNPGDYEYSNPVWAGFHYSAPAYAETGYHWITVDLGESYNLNKFVAYLGASGIGAGIGAANTTMIIAVSNDGVNFDEIGSVEAIDDGSNYVAVALKADGISARYVQYRFIRTGWVFVSEVEAYTAESTPDIPEIPLEDQLILDLGKANEDSNLDVIINAPDYYKAGDEITVEVTIQNISTKIHSLAFQFKYDSNKLWLMNDLDEWENNALMCVTLPGGWENFSTVANDYADKKEELDRVQNDDDETNDEDVQILPINNGIINASILTVSTTARDAINSITFTFTFKALEDSEGKLGFVIPHDSVECARNISTGVNIMNGNGSYAITHATAVLEGYDATCTEDGLTDGLYCPDCGYIIVEQEIIPAHGHDDGEWITVIEPGMGTEGLKELYCTACGELLASEILPPLYILGDVNNDGEINKYDYMLLKRHVMGTFTLDEIGLLAGDVNNDGAIDKYDYMLLKRHVMGTFVIETPEPVYWPVKGEINKIFSLDSLIYNETMRDYRTHSGIDIAADEGAAVVAFASGTVTDIVKDSLMGMTIEITHKDGKVSVYQNLSETLAEGIEIGAAVIGGQIIAAVGYTAVLETADPSHLHFEIIENGQHIDPVSVLP